jgi:hypothetical protein
MMGGEGESEHCFIPPECPYKLMSLPKFGYPNFAGRPVALSHRDDGTSKPMVSPSW